MPTAIKLDFIAQQNASLPSYMGRATNSAVLELLDIRQPDLVEILHDIDGPTPLTTSGFLGLPISNRQSQPIHSGKRYAIRITGLTPPVSQALKLALQEDPPRLWDLHGCRFKLVGLTCDSMKDPWTGETTYQSMATRHLTRPEKSKSKVALRFVSPVTFKSGGVLMPVPLPRLLFGSLADRWNAFSTIPLSRDLRDQVEERVVLSRYRMESQLAPVKNGAIIGGVGEATYAVKGDDSYLHAAVQLLADFAEFSSAGTKTTIGLGQIQRLK